MNSANMNGTNAPSRTPTNDPPPNVIRRVQRPKVNPFATARQPGQAPPRPNGLTPAPRVNGKPVRAIPLPQRSASPKVVASTNQNHYSGFSDPSVATNPTKYQDFKLVTTKKDLLEGLRHHIMHLTGDKKVDIRDSSQFAQPAHLHRRDPRTNLDGLMKDDQIEHKDGLKEGERENMSKLKELRQQERAANLAQIAPAQSKRSTTQKLKTKEVRKRDYSEEDKRRIQTNFEEKLPWHLEDFDNKHCYVGENQGPSAHRHVAFVYESAGDSSTGKFRLVPVEKVYEFNPKRFDRNAMSIEQAEAALRKRSTMPEWLERVEEKSAIRQKQQLLEERTSKLYSGEAKSNKYAGRTGEEADIDFDDEELFADDEEGDVIKMQDEDEKFAEKRIREDQLKANFFEVKTEREYDEEEEEEQKEKAARRDDYSRGIRKALEKHEGDYNHASDSEYSTSSNSEEETPEEAEKRKAAQLQDGATKPTAPPSGATTPSGRKDKTQSGLSDRDGPSKKSLKRPGSPNLSEAGSGTDTSTRKRPKTKHLSSTQPTPTISRPTSPANTLSSAPQKLKIRSGAGSDTDGGTLSDATHRKKFKKSQPGGVLSRAGSPGPGPHVRTNVPSRPSSTAPGTSSPVTSMPTHDDIRGYIQRSMPKGMTVVQFIQNVPHPKERGSEFIKLTLQIAKKVAHEDGRQILVLKDNAQPS